MNIVEQIDELKARALRDNALRKELLETRKAQDPLSAFCRKCRELGLEIYEMDLINEGEELYAAMKRSTNGAVKIPRCSREKTIFMSCFLRNYNQSFPRKLL